MSTRIVTLFGDEVAPVTPKPAAKGRAKKKGEEPAPAEQPAEQEGEEPAKIEPEPAAEAIQETPPAAGPAEVPVVEAVAVEPEAFVEPEPAETVAVAEQETPPTAEAQETPVPRPVSAPRKKKENNDTEKPRKEPAPNLPDDWDGDKKYYAIGEVAALFNVKTSHIRFWTNEFKLKVRTTRKGDRLYTPEQVKELRAIYHLVKERGFTLAGAKAKLKTQNKRDVETISLKDSLLQLKGKLTILRDQLTQ